MHSQWSIVSVKSVTQIYRKGDLAAVAGGGEEVTLFLIVLLHAQRELIGDGPLRGRALMCFADY